MYAVVYLPNFPLQVAQQTRTRSDEPMALVDVSARKPIISHVNETAAALEIYPGMTPTQAMARHAGLNIQSRALRKEQMSEEALIQIASSFSPAVEVTAPGTLTLDLARLSVPNLQQWTQKIVDGIQRLQFEAQIGIAETPVVALYAARLAKNVSFVQDPHLFLDQLPIETAEPSPELLDLLRRWGIRTMGGVTALGLGALVERLGPEGAELFEKASGHRREPLRRVVPSDVYAEELDLEFELEKLEPLLDLLRQFLQKICWRQELANVATEKLDLTLRFAKGPPYQQQLSIPAPTRIPAQLWRMLETHLESLKTEQPIIGLSLSAQACPPRNEQLSLFEGSLRDPNQFSMTLGRLGALLGRDRVGVPQPEDSYRPDAVEVLPVNSSPESHPHRFSSRPPEKIGLTLRRLRPPMPVSVTMGLLGPSYLQCSRLTGYVRKFQGPWRSSGQWWDHEKWQREEWDIETECGALSKIYRQDGEWFLEGFYD